MTVKTGHSDAKGAEKSGLSGPVVLLSRYLHKVLLPVVTGDKSIAMVANFQRFCGLQADGKVTNRFLNIYFRVASTAGEEIFTLMPLVFWLTLPVAVSFLTNFVVLQIAGQLAKDFFRLPRPISPPGSKNPIIKLDNHFDTEYGLPSTHTIAGLLPAATLLVLLRHGVPISTTAWIFSVIYWISVALSRLYMGVHSVYDVIAGAILGASLVAVLHAYGDSLDVFFYHCSSALHIQIALLALYITGYPRPGPWSASFGTAAQMMGPFVGCGVSLWYLFNVNHELRDVLLQSSMVNPRPYLLEALPSLTSPAEGATHSALSLAAVLAANGRALFGQPAEHWLHYNSALGATLTQTATQSAYTWYNTHPGSFNTLSTQAITYRMLVAAAIAGVGKVVFKLLPSLLFSGLCKAGITKVAKVQQKDCFDRDVPQAKAYVVEIPVRIINYGLLGMTTVLAVPYAWKHYGL